MRHTEQGIRSISNPRCTIKRSRIRPILSSAISDRSFRNPFNPVAAIADRVESLGMESKKARTHLKRLTRVLPENPMYFITCCCKQRVPILDDSVAHEILFDEWSNSRERHGWHIGKYVIMPDHVHFLASPSPDAKSLSKFMQAWKQWTSKRMAFRFPMVQFGKRNFSTTCSEGMKVSAKSGITSKTIP